MKSQKTKNKKQITTAITVCIMLLTPLLFLGEGLGVRSFAQVANGTGAGNCLNYNGTSNYVSIPSTQALNNVANTGSSATYSAWVKLNTLMTGGILNKMHSINDQSLCSVGITSGYVFLEVTNCNPFGAEAYLASSLPLTTNTWYNITVTHTYGDGSSTKIYVNGQLANGSWVVGTGNHSCNSTNTNPLRFGNRQHNGNPYWFDGQIDELCIWNKALTQIEIRDNMCKKLTGSESGLVGYWRFDEGSGSTANDATTNGNNGTLY